MMNLKSMRRIVLLAFMMFGVSAVCFAADPPPTKESSVAPVKKPGAPSTKKTKKTTPRKFTGNISTLNIKTGTVSVKGSSDEKNFIAKDAAKDALERLAVGDRVRVVYSENDGKAVATSVRRLKLAQRKSKTTAPNAKSTTIGEQKQTKENTKPGT